MNAHGTVKSSAGINIYMTQNGPVVKNQKYEALELMQRENPLTSDPLPTYPSHSRPTLHEHLLTDATNRYGSALELRRKRDGLL